MINIATVLSRKFPSYIAGVDYIVSEVNGNVIVDLWNVFGPQPNNFSVAAWRSELALEDRNNNLFDAYFCNISGYTGIYTVSSTGLSTRLYLDTYNNENNFGSSYRGRRFRGTQNEPSGILNGDVLLQLVGDGSYGSGIQNAVASMAFFAAENYVSGKAGTYIRLRTTPTGTTTALERILITQDGNIGINNSTPAYKLDVSGGGNLTQGLSINGINIGTGNFQTLSGFLSASVETTGSYLLGLIGAGGYSIANPNNYSHSGNLYSTGSILENRIISLSGDLLNTGSNLLNQINQINTNSGNFVNLFYSTTNPNNYVHSGNTGNLIANWQTGRFYGVENVNGYVSSGVTGLLTNTLIPRAESGQFYSIQNNNNYSTSGNLYSTGEFLLNKLNLLSGNLIQTGINILDRLVSLSGDVIVTGSNLDGKISTLSGQVVFSNQTGGFYRDNINSYSTSGNLYQTGLFIQNQLTSLSGDVSVIRGNLTQSGINLLNALSQVKITGSSTVLQPNFTGAGNINLYLSGANTIFVSGDTSNLATQPQIVTLTNNLVSTGSTLLNSDSILSGNLTTSGINILNRIASLSGDFLTDVNNLTNTGIILLGTIYSLSGDLLASGQNLQNQLRSISTSGVTGISVTGGAAITGHINFTGIGGIKVSQSGNNIITFSGSVGGGGGEVNTASNLGDGSGLFAQKSSVDLQFKSLSVGDGLYLTGDTIRLNITLTGNPNNYTLNSQTGNFYSTLNLNNYSNSGNLYQTGLFIQNQITSLSGDFLASGSRYIQLSGNLTSTGVNLTNTINGLSGAFNNTGMNLQTQITNIGNGTGNLYRIENFNNYISSGSVLVSGKIFSIMRSGDREEIFKVSLSGIDNNLGNVVISTGISGIVFESAARTLSGRWITNTDPSVSGHIVNKGFLDVFSGQFRTDLFATGSNLFVNDTVISGKLISLSGDLGSSGINLLSRIQLLSGNLNTTGLNSLNWITNVSGKLDLASGNLISTGITLLNRIDSLSGFVLSTGAFLTNRIDTLPPGGSAGGITGITITGGVSLTGLFGISQGVNITLTQIGNTGIMIAGPAGAGEANTASNLGNGSGLFSQKSSVDLQFKSLRAGPNIKITGDSNQLTIKCAQPFPLQFVSSAVTWTNMPLADTFFAGSVGYTQYIDLTNFTGVNLCVTKAATAGGLTSMLQLKYNGNFQSTVGNYLPLDSNAMKSRMNVQNTFVSSGYQPIVAAARSGVFVTLMGSGGDGTLDPVFGNIIAYFK